MTIIFLNIVMDNYNILYTEIYRIIKYQLTITMPNNMDEFHEHKIEGEVPEKVRGNLT